MSMFVQAVPAAAPKTKDTLTVSLLYVAILVVMVLAQLFSFDDFLKLMTSFELTGSMRFAYFMTALIVVTEVFALPFLLRMTVSPAFRFLSMVSSWLVALLWCLITLFLVLHHTPINNVGFLGTVVGIDPTKWSVFFSIFLAILAAWSSWGLWPIRKTTKRVRKA